MKPLQIRLGGFMSFRHEQTIHFAGMGMTAVTGPNGHGKSSIILGVAWALFGQTRVSGDRESIINDYENQAEVILDFEDRDGAIWRVHRIKYWQGNQELTLQHYDEDSGQWISEEDHTLRHNQQKIHQVTGLDEDTFYTLMAIEQNSIAGGTRFTAADSNTRRTILMGLLPELEIYQYELEGSAAEHHRELKSQVNDTLVLIDATEARIDSAKNNMKPLKAFLKDQPSVDDLKEKIDQEQTRLKRVEKLMDKENTGRAELKAMLEAEKAERRAAEAESRAERNSIQAELDKMHDLSAQSSKLRKTISSLSDEMDDQAESIDGWELDLASSKDQLGPLQEIIDRQQAEVAEAQIRYTTASNNALALEATVDALTLQHDHSGSGKCMVCDSDLSDERVDKLLLQAKQDQRQADDDLASAKDSLKAIQRKLDNNLTEQRSLETSIQRTHSRIEGGKQSLERIEKQLSQAKKDRKLVREELENLPDEDDLQAKLKAIAQVKPSKKESDLEEQISDLDGDSEHGKEHRQIKASIRSNQELVETILSRQSSLQTMKDSRAADKEHQKEHQSKLRELQDQVETATIVREACSQKGIPSMLIHDVLQSIEDRQNELLARMMGDNATTVEFRQERELKSREGSKSVLDIIVKTPDGFERSIESFSGGERVRLTMSNLFAMVQVFNERNPGLIRTLWLDEPFGALDVNSLPIMVDIIRDAISNDVVESVFVVTHQAEVSDAMPQSLMISKDPQTMSSVVEVV